MNRFVYFPALQLVFIIAPFILSAQTYCTPSVQMACFYGDKIVHVSFAGINHTDDVCSVDAEGQKDFTSTVSPAQVTAGNSYGISVGVENSFSTGTERVRIWIDFNHNYVFEDTESFDLGVGIGNTVLTATIPVPAAAVAGTTRMRVMYRRTSTNPLEATDACHAYGNYRGQLKDYAVTINTSSNCTSALAPGNTVSTLSAACPGELFTLSLQNTVTGPTYEWQSSVNGTTWTAISAATSTTLQTSQVSARYYRCVVTCEGNTGSSTPLLVGTNGPVYTTLPVHESFEAWSNMCGGTTNVPGSSWLTTPSTGNHSFRRDDQGASAAWTNTASGAYTPAASAGSHSARFHSSAAGAGSTGMLDLYVNCSTGAPSKSLTFDYLNTSGSDEVLVFVSTDGGASFSSAGPALTTAATWTSYTRTFTSSSAFTIVRFTAMSGGDLSDIGIDNVVLETVTICNVPGNLTVSGTTSSSAAVAWQVPNPVPVSGYEYVLSTVNSAPTGNGTPFSPATITHFGLSPATTYYFFVRSSCGAGAYSNWAMIPFTTLAVSTVSLDEMGAGEASQLIVYPNPALESVRVSAGAGSSVSALGLYTLSGQILSENPGTVLSVAGIPSGLYLLHIHTGESTYVKRLEVR